jgi:hypothetical protein
MSSEEITKEGRRSPRIVARIPLETSETGKTNVAFERG